MAKFKRGKQETIKMDPPAGSKRDSDRASSRKPSSKGASGKLTEADTIPMDGEAEAIKAEWAQKPAVEVELVHELRSPPYIEKPWHMLEIWTQNRIYAVDANMRCIEVIDQASQKSDGEHGLLGARLVGGQHRDGDRMHLSHPFPRPGTEAVFEQPAKGKATKFSQSSTVTRVVLRLRHVTIGSGVEVPTWDQIVGSVPPTFRSG